MGKKLTKRSEDYSKWYNELVVMADLAENSAGPTLTWSSELRSKIKFPKDLDVEATLNYLSSKS